MPHEATHRHYFHPASRISRLPGAIRALANQMRKGQRSPMFCACGVMRVGVIGANEAVLMSLDGSPHSGAGGSPNPARKYRSHVGKGADYVRPDTRTSRARFKPQSPALCAVLLHRQRVAVAQAEARARREAEASA